MAIDNVVEVFIYGESQPNAEDKNLRGQLYQLQDQSGVIVNSQYNLQGNILKTTRKFAKDYKGYLNWGDTVELEEENYTSKFTFNGIQQLIAETTPDGSVTTNSYNQLGLLERISVTLTDGTKQPIINSINYNAKGQRVAVDYGNGVKTSYSYEYTTWRLIKLHSTRSDRDRQGSSRQSVLQDIVYTYDPVGNITRLKDNTHATVFHNNQIVQPLSNYTYDALYRLVQANGRQHPGMNAGTYKNKDENGDFKQSKFMPLSNSNALENYQESYTYDDAGNLIKTTHNATNSWTRSQEIMPDSNRLKIVSSSNGFSKSSPITYDRSGNQQQLNGNSTVKLTFNCCENLVRATVIEREGQLNDADYYTYDSGEMRTRKVSERLVNGGAVIEKESKVYLGNYEVKRLQQNETTILKRQTLRIMDDETCVAIFHYWSQDERQREVEQPGNRKLRYQMDNHLGSVALEVDNNAQIISYEEYFPYGGTAFIAGKNQKEVRLKEYRYSGKERDDSTGLYYYGARYYAPWLGRWLKPDPAGTVDGLNLYGFVGGNPISFIDQKGLRNKRVSLSQAVSSEPVPKEKRTTRLQERLSKAKPMPVPEGVVGHYYRGDEHEKDPKLTKTPGTGRFGLVRKNIKSKIAEDIKNYSNGKSSVKNLPDFIKEKAKELYERKESALHLDADTKRINLAAGIIKPHGLGVGDKKPPEPYGGESVSVVDDKGHLVPEAGVSANQSDAVNTSKNIIAENWWVNQHYKKAFEEKVIQYANENPNKHVMTLHQPIYKSKKKGKEGEKRSQRTRPKAVIHYMVVDGVVVSAVTLKNTKKHKYDRP